MKKTIVALMALAALAQAGTVGESFTLGSYYTDAAGNKVDTVTAFNGLTAAQVQDLSVTGTELKADKGLNWKSVTITLSTADMFQSAGDAVTDDGLQITSIKVNCRTDGWYIDGSRYASITLNDVTYKSGYMTTASRTANTFGTSTFTFDAGNAPVIKLGDTVSITLASDSSEENTGLGAFQNISGAPAVYNSWQPSIQLNGTITTPEPATATLSLLALAGLAARRRRH